MSVDLFNHDVARAQRGAVLIVALIFLLLLTMLAISASGRSLLQERMAGSLRNAQQAHMSAETALRGAEWRLWASTSKVGGRINCLSQGLSSDDACTIHAPAANNPAYATGSTPGDVVKFRTGQGWVDGIGRSYTGTSATGDYTDSSLKTAQLAKNPAYIVEDMGRQLPPGAGPQHESGQTGPNNAGPGQLNTHVFRITARATGGSANTVRAVQSTFDAQANN